MNYVVAVMGISLVPENQLLMLCPRKDPDNENYVQVAIKRANNNIGSCSFTIIGY